MVLGRVPILGARLLARWRLGLGVFRLSRVQRDQTQNTTVAGREHLSHRLQVYRGVAMLGRLFDNGMPL